jgi:hypothetical protein
MAVLGKEPEGYSVYADQIRSEYIHVPENIYCSKRPEVLDKLAAGGSLRSFPKKSGFCFCMSYLALDLCHFLTWTVLFPCPSTNLRLFLILPTAGFLQWLLAKCIFGGTC